MALKFYGYFRSSAAYRCRIAFNLKSVQPEVLPVNLRAGEQQADAFTAINPQGLVPALDTGTEVLSQSLAIIEWLEEVHPQPPLLPADPVARAQVRAFAQIIACDIHPLQNLRVLNHLKARFGLDQTGAQDWCRHWIAEGLSACETVAAAQTHAGAFTFGTSPGLADICLIPQLFSADRFGVEITAFPRLQDIRAACDALPAFAAAHPSQQPDAI
ncbi:maleylacetoacetate isomerase [Paracoccus sp. SCSIO 75233]|uniref:maleylacetoacetate isomerase n=1 Tax=Paracoccus sp. SCSIO 75233 TaxID=3017782 RepID=UPI0022F00A11|nr:maleylacetoacetate isomerase [Paracoccus sp. SCSIO 75233]WBU53107.1 maleylacetoacetate isomerase [Paracoccus sp. SCSIO 75233]